MEDTKITIIEGPTPTFEVVYDNWANGIVDSANIASVALTRLRTANGPALVERCYRAWSRKDSIQLEFRATDGLTQEVPIVAARSAETDDGDMLLLWVRLPEKEDELRQSEHGGQHGLAARFLLFDPHIAVNRSRRKHQAEKKDNRKFHGIRAPC